MHTLFYNNLWLVKELMVSLWQVAIREGMPMMIGVMFNMEHQEASRCAILGHIGVR